MEMYVDHACPVFELRPYKLGDLGLNRLCLLVGSIAQRSCAKSLVGRTQHAIIGFSLTTCDGSLAGKRARHYPEHIPGDSYVSLFWL